MMVTMIMMMMSMMMMMMMIMLMLMMTMMVTMIMISNPSCVTVQSDLEGGRQQVIHTSPWDVLLVRNRVDRGWSCVLLAAAFFTVPLSTLPTGFSASSAPREAVPTWYRWFTSGAARHKKGSFLLLVPRLTWIVWAWWVSKPLRLQGISHLQSRLLQILETCASERVSAHGRACVSLTHCYRAEKNVWALSKITVGNRNVFRFNLVGEWCPSSFENPPHNRCATRGGEAERSEEKSSSHNYRIGLVHAVDVTKRNDYNRKAQHETWGRGSSG